MNVSVDLDDLLAAYEWVNAGEVAAVDAEAYIGRLTGKIHWCGEGVDEEPAEDIEDERLYIAVPHASEFDLGRSLAVAFVDEYLPRSRDTVREYFHRRGAYQRFKALLAQAGQLEAWHRYEQAAKEEALCEWCAENGFIVSRGADAG
jgi:hypothetical protein